ncbi:hypothetical protein [Rhizobium rhizogenes]|uniref:hypothetical protein n=1 Tax=Rhizobium rhizogenes TaxID=359 RepID=UPI0024BD8209|nr:hypothetical protein [Rhizobium rhizogenes]MDJ1632308.1 hypothetical protein [Rhizobium rhizogenes]
MSSIIERLLEGIGNYSDRGIVGTSAGLIREAAKYIQDLELYSAEVTAQYHALNEKIRREALEDAAKIVDDWLSLDGSEKTKFHDIAAAIRGLSESSPNPLPEQIANIGKEGG